MEGEADEGCLGVGGGYGRKLSFEDQEHCENFLDGIVLRQMMICFSTLVYYLQMRLN